MRESLLNHARVTDPLTKKIDENVEKIKGDIKSPLKRYHYLDPSRNSPTVADATRVARKVNR